MTGAIATFISLGFLSFAFVFAALVLSWRITPQIFRKESVSWLVQWGIKGLIFPMVLWAVMNVGLSWRLQPFMPEVQVAQAKGLPWFPPWLEVMAFGLFVVSSYWAAVTLGWAIRRATIGIADEARTNFKGLFFTCLLGMCLPAGIILLLGGWSTLGLAALAVLVPLAGYSPGILVPKKMPPMYARAVARMKFGKYSEAEWEIIRELEKCEDDFDGWMMLAELYAVHFRDLEQAEQTILEICDQPKTTPSQLSVGLHRLADWHLKITQDPDAATRALQLICDRLPGTHLARLAQLRVNQLPRSAEELKAQHEAHPIPLPALADHDIAPMERHQAAQAANECVDQLKRDPNNIAAREKLARTFAEHLGQPDLGLEQLLLLLNMPGQSDIKRAEWLALSAAWHLRFRQDTDTGRKLLEKVVAEFPGSPQAFAARRRLELIARNTRGDATRS